MQNPQETAKRIKLLAKTKGISVSKLLTECDLNKNAIFTMQTRGSWLQAKNLAKIAEFLNCSIDYLMGRTNIPEVNGGGLTEKQFSQF